MSAGTPKKVKADRYGVKESASVELLSKKSQDGEKMSFRCRIARYDGDYMLFAKILKNDSLLHVARPGVKFMLADGDSVVVKAERPETCSCSNWADGRWYNTSFRFDASDVEKLTGADILSVAIPFYGGEISRPMAPGKGKAIRELLQSVGED